MPRLLAVVLAVLVVAGIAACGPEDEGPDLSRFAAVSVELPHSAWR